MYLLNENTKLRVRTPVGVSDSTDIGPTVGQGTISGAILSANSLDGGVVEYVHPRGKKSSEVSETNNGNNDDEEEKENEGTKYAEIDIFPLLYQDDLTAVSDSVDSAQNTNDKIESMMESKLLDLHETKSKFIIVGKKKARVKLEEEVKRNPLKLYQKRMLPGTVEKCLGFFFHQL